MTQKKIKIKNRQMKMKKTMRKMIRSGPERMRMIFLMSLRKKVNFLMIHLISKMKLNTQMRILKCSRRKLK